MAVFAEISRTPSFFAVIIPILASALSPLPDPYFYILQAFKSPVRS